jgi:hypothetical protein
MVLFVKEWPGGPAHKAAKHNDPIRISTIALSEARKNSLLQAKTDSE